MTFRWKQVLGAAIAVALLVTACGGAATDLDLSDQAQRGRVVADSKGCAACHGRNGEGGVGPAWAGLAGGTVELEGGAETTADSLYLRRSIVEPQADIVAGSTVSMPTIDLSDEEITDLISYIEELR